jgi:hypothetical protein
MFGAENRQFPRQTDEIKRPRCETLESSKRCVSRPFEFGGVFDPTGILSTALSHWELGAAVLAPCVK